MKKIVFFLALLLQSAIVVIAQDVDIDKSTGLVQVDGKDAFYLMSRNKKLIESDYALENLEHKELAYLKYQKYGSDASYYMVFTKSGNQCVLTGFGTLGTVKHIIKTIAGAHLVQNNAVSEEEERKFIILHHGTFVKDPGGATAPPTEKVTMPASNDNKRTAGPADISVKGNNIYNNSELVGVFKSVADGGNTVVSVYNANDAMICRATHADSDPNADWNLVIDGKAVTLLYNTATPLEKLFKYLAEKGYL